LTGVRRLVIVLIVIIGLLVVADRVAKVAAQGIVAGRIESEQGLSERPHVAIHGFPFLTQALGGRYDNVSLTMHDLRDRAVPVKRLSVDLHGVHVPLGAVISRHLSRVPVDRATATVLLSFADLNAYLGGKHLTVSNGSDGEIKVTGSATVAGQTVSASASGRIDVSGSDLTVAVGRGLDFSIPLGGLPFRIALVGAKATKAGILVQATASGLVLHPRT
jgi:hypothetical protein